MAKTLPANPKPVDRLRARRAFRRTMTAELALLRAELDHARVENHLLRHRADVLAERGELLAAANHVLWTIVDGEVVG